MCEFAIGALLNNLALSVPMSMALQIEQLPTKDTLLHFQFGDHRRRRFRSIQIQHQLLSEHCQLAVNGPSLCVVDPKVQLWAMCRWIYQHEIDDRYI